MVDGHITASVTAAFPAKIEIHIKSGFIAAGAAMCFALAVVLALLCGLVVRLVRLRGRRRSRIRVRGRGGGFRHGRRLRHSRRFGGLRGFLRFFGRLRGGHQLNGAVDVAIAGPVSAAVTAAIDSPLPGQFGQVGNVDGLGADIKPVDRLIDQGIHGFARAVHPAGQVIQLAGQLTGRSRGIVGAIVHAAFHIAGLAAGNTADIIANVAVANGSAVDAGAQHTGIVARNAACIGHIVGLFGFQHIVQGQVIQLDFVLAHGGIHAGHVGAVGSYAVILAHNAAHKVAAVHCAAYRAAIDAALDRIDTGNAANLAGAGYHAIKRAIFNRTGVAARNAAHAGAGAARLDTALYRHIAHQGPLLHIAE